MPRTARAELTNSAPLEDHFEQLGATHRAAWKGQHAVAVLALALAQSDAWWDHVDAVQGGADPLKIAGRYGKGRRADVVTLLLQRAASESPRSDAARVRMVNTAIAVYFPDEQPAPTRRFDDRYRQRLVLGAECVARRGAGACVACGRAPGQRAPGHALADYCRACDSRELVACKQERERAIRELFDSVRRAVPCGAFRGL